MKSFKISSDCHIKACRSLKWRAILKIPILKEPMLFLLALKWNLYEKAFSWVKTKTNFCCKPCWNAERSNHSFLSNWWIAFSNICTLLIMWQYKYRNWLCKHRKKVRSSLTCMSKHSCTKLSKTKFSLYRSNNFLRGLCSRNPLLRNSSPSSLQFLFRWLYSQLVLMIYILDIIKWHVTNLFSGESNICYPSGTTSVQHFTKNFYVSWF